MAPTRAQVWIEGRVQGVYFRSYTCNWAEEAGVCGWVKNLPDGNVEAVFEGEEEDIREVIGFIKQGPPYAQVTGIKVNWMEPTGEFNSFSIRY